MTLPRPTFPRALLAASVLALPMVGSGCIEHRVKTDPIHITMDINVRVDQELKEFFAYEEQVERDVLKTDASPSPQEPKP